MNQSEIGGGMGPGPEPLPENSGPRLVEYDRSTVGQNGSDAELAAEGIDGHKLECTGVDKYDMAEQGDVHFETPSEELVRVKAELEAVKAELEDALKKNETFHEVNLKHIGMLTWYKHEREKDNEGVVKIQAYIKGLQDHIAAEEVKLKNVAIAYHNINSMWKSVKAVASRLAELRKSGGILGPNGNYINSVPLDPGKKPDLVDEKGQNLDGTKRDNIVNRLDGMTRLASAIAHGRVVDKNAQKHKNN